MEAQIIELQSQIAELQVQLAEMKEAVGFRPKPERKIRKSARHWEGIPEIKPESMPEPEKDLTARIEELERDVNTIKAQIEGIFHAISRSDAQHRNNINFL